MSSFDIEPPGWMANLDGNLEGKILNLPRWLKDKLFSLGEDGFNNHLMGVSRSLSKHFDSDELKKILRACADSYTRAVPDDELKKAISKAYDKSPTVAREAKAGYDKTRVRNLIATTRIKSVEELEAEFGKEETQTAKILPWLFENGSLVCASKSPYEAETKFLDEWLGAELAGVQFVVPSPMSKRWGTTKQGKDSIRCLDNTGKRKYLVTEFDKGTQDEQAACIAHLSTISPLVLVVFSGNKSLHAWFEVKEANESILERFMDYAVTLGADRATWSKCQLVRMPAAIRDNGTEQRVIVFCPTFAEIMQWKPELIPPSVATNIDDFTPRHFSEYPFSTEASDFIEGLLTKESVSIILGSPGAGKSFFALDLAASVASGRDWRNREVEAGGVIYICLEGVNGFKGRIEAFKRAGMLQTHDPFYLLPVAVDLLNDEHREKLCDSISKLMERSACPISLIVIDTLSRGMPGGDENSGEAMGKMLATVDALKVKVETHVCLVHHVGKDASKGARGHSSLKGAIDTEITITRDEITKISTAKVTKQKDLECDGIFRFKLHPVSLGYDSKGREITSCTVEHLDGEGLPTKRGRPSKNSPGDLLDLLPVGSSAEWKEKAERDLKIPTSRFYTLRKELEEESKFEIDPDGRIISKMNTDSKNSKSVES